jgi:alkylation response protein AidB-like acyl-CoA dehydrogenase
MNFDFNDDQKALRDQARRFLKDKCSSAVVRTVLEDGALGFDRDLWAQVAALGWLGVAIPEEFGGLGLGKLELCVLAEEMGRALAPIPFASSLYFFGEGLLLAGSDAQKAEVLPLLAAGSVIGCYAASEGPGAPSPASLTTVFDGATLTGVKIPVTDGDSATHALVLAREGAGTSLVLVALDQAGVTRTPVKTLDPSRGHARLEFRAAAAARVGAAGDGWALSEAILDRAAVLLAFEQIGGADACLEMATDYAKNRYAFSRQIGSFQAIKHKLADIYVANQVGRANAYYAAWALSTDAGELSLAAAQARVAACEAFHLASKENIQTHGGMGFTWQVDCHLYYRRAKLLGVQAGAAGLWKEKLVSRLERRNAA